jgi:hypothetical protein
MGAILVLLMLGQPVAMAPLASADACNMAGSLQVLATERLGHYGSGYRCYAQDTGLDVTAFDAGVKAQLGAFYAEQAAALARVQKPAPRSAPH